MLYIVNRLRDSFTPNATLGAVPAQIFPQSRWSTDMDKRDLSTIFRERLKMLLTRSDLNQSAFATAVGIDRSALSQLLSGASTRLPRAETLLN
ncbi:helix-turn-helix transcriptional regulator, partial [Mesorhizobium sp. M7A.F.Ca.CA.001.08.2.1]|uniref:helix-turn-helix domain-containing protein n=1 Tax=Mesorhizobium sp. M7A.F.Ca.CA.001.08.2.1 TaxID=2496692 RepID=UPI001FE0D93A